MQSPLDRHIIVSELDFARLTRLLEHDGADLDALEAELARALVLRPSAVPETVVTMNSEVEYEETETQIRRVVRVVYPRDADAARGRVSVLAPVGSALLGLRVGQSIRWPLPAGPRTIRVVAIRYQPEAAGDYHL